MNILWDFDGTLFDTYPAYTMMLSEILGDSVEKTRNIQKLKKYHTLMQFSIIIFHASRKKRLKF